MVRGVSSLSAEGTDIIRKPRATCGSFSRGQPPSLWPLKRIRKKNKSHIAHNSGSFPKLLKWQQQQQQLKGLQRLQEPSRPLRKRGERDRRRRHSSFLFLGGCEWARERISHAPDQVDLWSELFPLKRWETIQRGIFCARPDPVGAFRPS